MNFTYLVEVKSIKSFEVVKSIEVIGSRKADKVARGIEINMSPAYLVTVTKKDSV